MVDYWINIVTYLVEFLIASLVIMSAYPFKRGALRAVIYGLIAYGIALAVFVAPFTNPYINTAVFLIANILWIYFAFYTNIKNSIAVSIILTALMTASEFCSMYFVSIFLKVDINDYNKDESFFIIFDVFSKTLYFILAVIARQISKQLKNKSDDNIKTPIYLFVYPLCSLLILFVFWVVTMNNDLSYSSKMYMSAGAVVTLFATIITYAFYIYTKKKESDLIAAETELRNVQINESYYKLLDYQSEGIKQLAHDEKNHLLTIKAMSENPEIDRYIDNIYSDLQKYISKGLTNNKSLDFIINRYTVQCEADGINFLTNIRTANLSFMDDSDLISLLSNLMDNAVESSNMSDNKEIELSINMAMGATVITCKNSCDTAPDIRNRLLNTSKSDKSKHGFGTKIIKRIVKKYSGEYTWRYDDSKNEFISVIAFSM